MKQAVFLDRDGVLNEVLTSRVKFVNKPKDLYLLEGAAKAVARLNHAGYDVYVVTNQGGVGLGYMKEEELQLIHDHLISEVAKEGGKIIEAVYCPHKPHAGCRCRKPGAGMLFDLAKRHGIDLANSVMAGDHERDIEAGKKAGCKTVFIGSGKTAADCSASTLFNAVPAILDLLRNKK